MTVRRNTLDDHRGMYEPRPQAGRRRPLSLRVKLNIATGVVFTVTFSAVVLITILLQTHQLERKQHQELELVASNIRVGVLNMMLRGRPDGLDGLLAAYGEHDMMANAEILNAEMRVVASSRVGTIGRLRPVTNKDIFHGPYTAHNESHGKALLTRIEPMLNGPTCRQCHGDEENVIGYILVSVSEQPLQDMIKELAHTMMKSSAATLFLLLIATSLSVSVLVINPMQDLLDAMKRAEAGDLSVRAPEEAISQEFEQMGEGFNAMLERLVAARSELVSSYKERLLQADRFVTVGELASGLAHEIKNPLAGLSGALQILASEYEESPNAVEVTALARAEDSAEKREIIEEMQHQITRLERAMEHLLRFARPQAPDMRHIVVNATIERTLSLVRKYRNADKVQTTTDLQSTAVVMVDPLQLEQVLLNLCLNAVQAMPDGGELNVRTYDDDESVVIKIQDNGPGIPAAVRADIFKPFFTTKTSGTGLGLPITKRIIDEHLGTIEVHCPPQGGTCFTLTFPRGMDSPVSTGEQLNRATGVASS